MKNIMQNSILLFFLSFLLLSCNDDNEPDSYYTKFYAFSWDVDTVPVIVPSSALGRTFQIKDWYGKIGGIDGVTGAYAISQWDTVEIFNTALNADLKKAIISDTIRGAWFTIITEEKRRIRVILDKNEEMETRSLEVPVWAYQLVNTHEGVPYCDNLIIRQLPSKNE